MCNLLKNNSAAITVFLSNLFFTIMSEEDSDLAAGKLGRAC